MINFLFSILGLVFFSLTALLNAANDSTLPPSPSTWTVKPSPSVNEKPTPHLECVGITFLNSEGSYEDWYAKREEMNNKLIEEGKLSQFDFKNYIEVPADVFKKLGWEDAAVRQFIRLGNQHVNNEQAREKRLEFLRTHPNLPGIIWSSTDKSSVSSLPSSSSQPLKIRPPVPLPWVKEALKLYGDKKIIVLKRMLGSNISAVVDENKNFVAIVKLGAAPQDALIPQIMKELGMPNTVPENYFIPSTPSGPSMLIEKPVIFAPPDVSKEKWSDGIQQIYSSLRIRPSQPINLDSLSKAITREVFPIFQNKINQKMAGECFVYYFVTNAHDLYKRNILVSTDGKQLFIACIDHDETLRERKNPTQREGIVGDKTDLYGLKALDKPLHPDVIKCIKNWNLEKIETDLRPKFEKAGIADKFEAFMKRVEALKTVIENCNPTILPRNIDLLASCLVMVGAKDTLFSDKFQGQATNTHTSWFIDGKKLQSIDLSTLPLIENDLTPITVGKNEYKGFEIITKFVLPHFLESQIELPKLQTLLYILGGYLNHSSPLYKKLTAQMPQLDL